MSKLINRFLLVSDMHYTTDLTAPELEKIHPGSNASAANGDAFGKTQGQKVEKIYNDVSEEHSRAPLDAVLVLGDLSIDDFDFRHLPENFCKKFKEECMDRLPCPAYAIPGNHDSYPNKIWRDVFGYDRQFARKIGDCVFVMLDTFRDIPAKSASGANLTASDGSFLAECINKYRGNKIFICAHYLTEESFSEEEKRLIRDSSDVVFMYRGHTHKSETVDTGDTFGDKKLIDIGGYGYQGIKMPDGHWSFSLYDDSWAWGYQVLEVYDDKIRTYHVRVKNTYEASNGVFYTAEALTDEITV